MGNLRTPAMMKMFSISTASVSIPWLCYDMTVLQDVTAEGNWVTLYTGSLYHFLLFQKNQQLFQNKKFI